MQSYARSLAHREAAVLWKQLGESRNCQQCVLYVTPSRGLSLLCCLSFNLRLTAVACNRS
jgi:hypothetical protein